MRDPVILIGAARSGTKVLRDLLAASGGVRAVPYDINYVWRYGASGDDALDPAALNERQKRFIRRMVPRLAKARAGDLVIEKTVSNTLRVPYVNAVFPEARFVHLVRDGRAVAESAMRQWQAPPDWKALAGKLRGMPLANLGYAAWFGGNFLSGLASGRGGGKVWGPRFPGLDDSEGLAATCAAQWAASVETARRDLAALPPERVFEIRYEDMVADPSRIGALARAMGLPDPEAVERAAHARLRAGHDAFGALPSSDRAAIERRLASTLRTMGYAA